MLLSGKALLLNRQEGIRPVGCTGEIQSGKITPLGAVPSRYLFEFLSAFITPLGVL